MSNTPFLFCRSSLEGVDIVELPSSRDLRGEFTRIFQSRAFPSEGRSFEINEIYVSASQQNVIRGLHFQTPPHQHAKMVVCLDGSILDVAVDLRRNSPTYGEHFATELSAGNKKSVIIGEGFAHGFATLSSSATVLYLVTSVYAPESDRGVLWNSCGISWPVKNPILSERDKSFPKLSEFHSPFQYLKKSA